MRVVSLLLVPDSCWIDALMYRFPLTVNHSPILESWTKREDTGEVEARAVTPCGSGNPNMVPECLQAMYGIPTTPATQSSNQIAVTGYDNLYAQQADLQVGDCVYGTSNVGPMRFRRPS